MTIYEIFKMELSSWTKPSRVLLLCSISFLNYGSFIGCIYFYFYLLLLLSTIKKKKRANSSNYGALGLSSVIFCWAKTICLAEVWNQNRIRKKKKEGRDKVKDKTKILINVVWEWVGSKDGRINTKGIVWMMVSLAQ